MNPQRCFALRVLHGGAIWRQTGFCRVVRHTTIGGVIDPRKSNPSARRGRAARVTAIVVYSVSGSPPHRTLKRGCNGLSGMRAGKASKIGGALLVPRNRGSQVIIVFASEIVFLGANLGTPAWGFNS